MDPDIYTLPLWLRSTHLINFLLMGIVLRSGWEILASLPRLWWRTDCAPGTEWLRFTRRKLPKEEGVYTSLMDEKSLTPIIGLPGRKNVGLGRHWHGFGVSLWLLNGFVYVFLLFATGMWRRIIPTSWEIFPEAWESLLVYLSLQKPGPEHFTPYDALQQLGYAGVIFIIAPLMMLTGIAMSPAVRSRFPWYVKFWGGHQGARSIHFLGMVAMTGFIIIHVTLVFVVYRESNLTKMVFGEADMARYAQAFTTILLTIFAIVVFWIALSYLTLANRPRAHSFLVAVTEPIRKFALARFKPRMAHQTTWTDEDISAFHWTNGLPPTKEESPEWLAMRDEQFTDWKVTIGDRLTGREKQFSLDELHKLPRASYVAMHTCMQGWSAISRWEGVRLEDLMAELGPRPEGANYVMVTSYGLAQEMYDDRPREPFYATLDLDMLAEEDTILAFRRNGELLDLHLGAPARLRVESNHGYKMVKWVRSIEWIDDYANYGDGRGGTREDSALQAFDGRI